MQRIVTCTTLVLNAGVSVFVFFRQSQVNTHQQFRVPTQMQYLVAAYNTITHSVLTRILVVRDPSVAVKFMKAFPQKPIHSGDGYLRRACC